MYWLTVVENSFRHFDGVTDEVVIDNARALPLPATGGSSLRLAHRSGLAPRAKMKAEWAASSATPSRDGSSKPGRRCGHLACWMREVAGQRVDRTAGERPIERFRHEEAAALKPLDGQPPFAQAREVPRKGRTDLCVELDTDHSSVPWRMIGEEVTVLAGGW